MPPNRPTVKRLDYRPALRVVNRLAWAARMTRLPITRIDPDSILDEARRRTGLADWGDPAFLGGLRRLVAEADTAQLTDLARFVMRGALAKAVMNRLFIQDYVRRHPEVEQIPVTKPIFILGFPRTGTTVLQNLLGLDAGCRALRFWELMTPVPIVDDLVRDARDRRRRATWLLRAAYFIAPEQDEIHHVELESPEECWPLFYNSLAAMNFDLQSGMTRFGDWLLGNDMEGPYREYRRQLQILSHRQPRQRFVLKCPEHLWFLDALLRVFPDASIVWTHRDPVACIGSYCSLISLSRRMLYGKVDLHGIGRHIASRFRNGVGRAMAVRDRIGEDNFHDVDFPALVKDVPAEIRRIKERFGIDHGVAEATAVERWMSADRVDGKGIHRYSPEHYGLDPARIGEDFAGYVERFGVAVCAR